MNAERTDVGISSLMDTWLLLRNLETSGERTRGLYILKSRGTAHSNQIREFVLSERGVDLIDAYTGPDGVLTGSARIARAAREAVMQAQHRAEFAEREQRFEQKRAVLQAQIAALQAELQQETATLEGARNVERVRDQTSDALRSQLEASRSSDKPVTHANRPRKRNGRSEARR